MSRRLIAEATVGHRTECGTAWPVVNQLHREELHGRVRWVYTHRLCNGYPDREHTRPFARKRDALAHWCERSEGGTDVEPASARWALQEHRRTRAEATAP